MPVKLKTIKFNHNTNSITNDAITIRKNKTQTVNVPEWVDGVSVLAEDSKAAYAMLETNGNTITIQANFQLINSNAGRAQIRAIDAVTDPRNQGGCIGWLIYLLLTIIKAIFGNVLGDVKARWVSFNNGTSAYETFELVNPKIWSSGVGIHFTEWQWQYRFGQKGKWHNMQISKHKIYIILEAPKSAWNQTAGSDHLPWTEVLDYSCSWALAAKTKVYQLYPELKVYLLYQAPYFRLRVGNFKTMPEAEPYQKTMAKQFQGNVTIVRDIIEVKPEKFDGEGN